MRLWSLHPQYLDAKGLVALWREGLLAQHVLAGKTRGYKHHPQLARFKEKRDPLAAIGTYLSHVVVEAVARGYSFDQSKILKPNMSARKILKVSRGQLRYEFAHLRKKLKRRDKAKFKEVQHVAAARAHPMMGVVMGGIAEWERLSS